MLQSTGVLFFFIKKTKTKQHNVLIKQNILTLKVQHGHVKTFLQLDKWGEMNKYSVPKKKRA